MKYKLAALSALMLGTSAEAQVLVLGTGLARTCYETALTTRETFSRDAIDTCTRALRDEPLNAKNKYSTLINRGILYMRNGEYDEAMADYDAALEIDATKGESYLNRGAAYIYQKKFAEAKVELDKAIELNSDNLFAAYYNRGIALERLGDLTPAYWDFRKSLELNPEFAHAEKALDRFIVETVPAGQAG